MQALSESTKNWMQHFPQLEEYASKFECVSGEQMLELKDEELLCNFDIESDVDRQYVHVGRSARKLPLPCEGTCSCNWHASVSTRGLMLISGNRQAVTTTHSQLCCQSRSRQKELSSGG